MKIIRKEVPEPGWPNIRASLTRKEAADAVDILQEEGYSLYVEHSLTCEPLFMNVGIYSTEDLWKKRLNHVTPILKIPDNNIIYITSSFPREKIIEKDEENSRMMLMNKKSDISFHGNGIAPEQILGQYFKELTASKRGEKTTSIRTRKHPDYFFLFTYDDSENILKQIQHGNEQFARGSTRLMDLEISYRNALDVVEISQKFGITGSVSKDHMPLRVTRTDLTLTPKKERFLTLTDRQKRLFGEIQSMVPEENIEDMYIGPYNSSVEAFDLDFNSRNVPPRLIIDRYLRSMRFEIDGTFVGLIDGPSISCKGDTLKPPHIYKLSIFEKIKNDNLKPEYQEMYENTIIPKAREFGTSVREKLNIQK